MIDIDDQIRNPNVNNRDHLVGRPTTSATALPPAGALVRSAPPKMTKEFAVHFFLSFLGLIQTKKKHLAFQYCFIIFLDSLHQKMEKFTFEN